MDQVGTAPRRGSAVLVGRVTLNQATVALGALFLLVMALSTVFGPQLAAGAGHLRRQVLADLSSRYDARPDAAAVRLLPVSLGQTAAPVPLSVRGQHRRCAVTLTGTAPVTTRVSCGGIELPPQRPAPTRR